MNKLKEYPELSLKVVTEEYTSKTCGQCGKIHQKLYGNKTFICPSCSYKADRDLNAARNIMIKSLNMSQYLYVGGYYGPKCELFNCNGIPANSTNVCNGFGNCTDVNKCNCNTGHTNAYCDRFYCFGVYKTFSSACSSHGKCLAHDTCNCTTGYYGSKCDNFNCFGLNKTDANVCSAHGTCTDIDKCRCDSTYGGSRCHLTSKNVCYGYNALHSKSCSGSDKSECVGANNCTCFPGYSSKDCSYWECFGKNNTDTTGCSGRGTCTGANNVLVKQVFKDNNAKEFQVLLPQSNPTWFSPF